MFYSEFYNDCLDHQYSSLGIQYYLLARFGSQFPFNPASGSLYHHCFELLLKSYLMKNGYSASKLKLKFSHNLVKLWTEFKKDNDSSLEKYDLIIKNLDSWERVRYITFNNGGNAQAIEIIKGHAPKSYLDNIRKANFSSQKWFSLYLDDMDELFYVFFSVLKVPPKELLKVPDFAWGKHIYEKDNKFNILKKS